MRLVAVAFAFLFLGEARGFLSPSAFGGRHIARTTCRNEGVVTMKLFDWKRRENPDGQVLDELRPDTLKGAPGARRRPKRKGRGIAAGQGASCGFGMRGQKSRSGPGVRVGFEGGQTELYRRIPKYVGRPMGPGHVKKQFNLIKLDAMDGCDEGSVVNFESLRASGAVTKTKHKWHKVVGGRELKVSGLTVQAHGFTQSAVTAIEEKGGKCQLLSPTTNRVIEMEEDEEEEEEDEKETIPEPES